MAITALLALLCSTFFTFYWTNYRNMVAELFITTTYRMVISVTLLYYFVAGVAII